MNRNETSDEAMSPDEYAELVRDARTLVAAVERAARRAGVVFVASMGLTVAATALRVPVVGEVAAVLAVLALTVALVIVMARIALGPMPDEVAHTTPAESPPTAPNGSARPATGSGAATGENRRILRK